MSEFTFAITLGTGIAALVLYFGPGLDGITARVVAGFALVGIGWLLLAFGGALTGLGSRPLELSGPWLTILLFDGSWVLVQLRAIRELRADLRAADGHDRPRGWVAGSLVMAFGTLYPLVFIDDRTVRAMGLEVWGPQLVLVLLSPLFATLAVTLVGWAAILLSKLRS